MLTLNEIITFEHESEHVFLTTNFFRTQKSTMLMVICLNVGMCVFLLEILGQGNWNACRISMEKLTSINPKKINLIKKLY